MPERGNVLAVDIGRRDEAVLFDGQGRILSLARRAYAMLTPRPDWAEQDPEMVYPAVLEAIREPIRTGHRASQWTRWLQRPVVQHHAGRIRRPGPVTLSHLVGPSQRGHRRSSAAV